MSTTAHLMTKFLQDLHSNETLDSLNNLLEYLEKKNDPEPFEMQIVENAYLTLEKLKTLEGFIKRYIAESNILPGNNLQRLYDKSSDNVGTQTFFD